MLSAQRPEIDRPILFCLHYLGGSAREWDGVVRLLEPTIACVAIDLPGFGDAAQQPGYRVAEMAEYVARAIRSSAPRRWLLAGHSMGAKVAAAVARGVEDGAGGLAGLAGLILLAGSPPGPEPMPDSQRETMRGWFAGDLDSRRVEATRYIAQNCHAPLSRASAEQAVTDVLRMNRAAWLAWLEHGSREDLTEAVGILRAPTLIIAGANDENLGPDAQRRLMVPHFSNVRLETLASAKHLLPLENTPQIARLMAAHIEAIGEVDRIANTTTTPDAYGALIASNRVGATTRDALTERARPDDPAYAPAALSEATFAILRAVAARIIPQPPGSTPIDLAARIDTELAAGVGDGWRFAELPPDTSAYFAGLLTVNDMSRSRFGRDFIAVDDDRQDELLREIGAERSGAGADAAESAGRLGAAALRAWFEDLRAAAVRAYVAHPRTLARMGYSGIANGGDGEPKSGFLRIGLGERETWEPIAARDAAV